MVIMRYFHSPNLHIGCVVTYAGSKHWYNQDLSGLQTPLIFNSFWCCSWPSYVIHVENIWTISSHCGPEWNHRTLPFHTLQSLGILNETLISLSANVQLPLHTLWSIMKRGIAVHDFMCCHLLTLWSWMKLLIINMTVHGRGWNMFSRGSCATQFVYFKKKSPL